MQVLKNIGFGLMHGFIMLAVIGGVECLGIFGLAMPIGNTMKAAGYNPWLIISVAMLCFLGPIALMWKPLLRYIDWLEPNLKRRERQTDQWFRQRQQARLAGRTRAA